jgi:hypothetical protein
MKMTACAVNPMTSASRGDGDGKMVTPPPQAEPVHGDVVEQGSEGTAAGQLIVQSPILYRQPICARTHARHPYGAVHSQPSPIVQD